jgi:aspartyl-tRNA(Asn)/glutamyl-tRNA(Gln) amidotransferase subunit A
VRALSEGLAPTAYLEAEALRVEVAHRMAAFHQRHDLALCPTVPEVAPRCDAKLDAPEELLWSAWAPWTFTMNLSRQPAISLPAGLGAAGLPLAVQLSAALYRDDLVLRGAQVVEAALGRLGVAPL